MLSPKESSGFNSKQICWKLLGFVCCQTVSLHGCLWTVFRLGVLIKMASNLLYLPETEGLSLSLYVYLLCSWLDRDAVGLEPRAAPAAAPEEAKVKP